MGCLITGASSVALVILPVILIATLGGRVAVPFAFFGVVFVISFILKRGDSGRLRRTICSVRQGVC